MEVITERELEEWFEFGQTSHVNEPQFFSRLLRAMVYVHAPASDDSKHLRLIQFRHPGGFEAIPVFTSPQRCARASSTAVRVVRLPCIELLMATRGATLMVNPNDGGPVLYPEEISALLDGHTLGTFEKVTLEGSWDVRPANDVPETFVKALRAGVASAPFIKQVYVLEKRTANDETSDTTLLIYLGVETAHMDRGARHAVSIIQSLDPAVEEIVDVAVYDMAQPRPEFLDQIRAVSILD